MSPNQFTGTFCNRCLNQECERSAAEGTAWFRRISTQEDRLLLHPTFADPRDSRFQGVANLDFRSALKEAITLELADRRGDWSIPTDADVAIEASRIATGQGMSPPPASPYPPTPDPPTPDPPTPNGVVLRVTVRGQTADYDVTLDDDGAWACSCPAFRFARANPCRHIQQAVADLESGGPRVNPATPEVPIAPPPAPGFRPVPPSSSTPPRPPMRNIPMPSGGVMADGTAPPPRPTAPPPADDPWAVPPDRAPPSRGTVVAVGGRVVMGKKP